MKLLEIKRQVDPAIWKMFQEGIITREELEILLRKEEVND